MLTYQDCLDMCEFTKDEIMAIADHEHISNMHAIILAEALIHTKGGAFKIQRMIMDDIEEAVEENDAVREGQLREVLKHFMETHPNALQLDR